MEGRRGGPERGEHGRHGRHARGGTRCRWWRDEPAGWEVRARIERFVEPALLLVLRDGDTHGYDLADALAGLMPDETIDLGNLYRLLRSLEEEGLVRSEWRHDLPGRAKRTYELTEPGQAVLDAWAASLRQARTTIDAFLTRTDNPQERNTP